MFLPVRSVGVMGDGRTYEYVVALRAVQTTDFMTAHWAPLPHELLAHGVEPHHQRSARHQPRRLRHLRQAAGDDRVGVTKLRCSSAARPATTTRIANAGSDAAGAMNACRRFRVSGRVQGVAYRAWTRMQADALGLTGWAMNLDDGRVGVFACGEAKAIDRLHRLLREGPPAAHVTGIDELPADSIAPLRASQSAESPIASPYNLSYLQPPVPDPTICR